MLIGYVIAQLIISSAGTSAWSIHSCPLHNQSLYLTFVLADSRWGNRRWCDIVVPDCCAADTISSRHIPERSVKVKLCPRLSVTFLLIFGIFAGTRLFRCSASAWSQQSRTVSRLKCITNVYPWKWCLCRYWDSGKECSGSRPLQKCWNAHRNVAAYWSQPWTSWG